MVAKQVRYISTGGRPHQRPSGPPAIEKVIDRYIERTAPARTHHNLRTRFRVFTSWLAEHHPEVINLAQLTRTQLEEFLTWVATGYRNYRTGQPVSVSTQVHTISVLNVFLRKTLAWGWDDVPARPLLSHLDMPKQVKTVPRYLPAPELDAIVEAIRALTHPYQRAACLIARWVGPRRSEIRRLELDCLDAYPRRTSTTADPGGQNLHRTHRSSPSRGRGRAAGMHRADPFTSPAAAHRRGHRQADLLRVPAARPRQRRRNLGTAASDH